jgi:hypothetical protein
VPKPGALPSPSCRFLQRAQCRFDSRQLASIGLQLFALLGDDLRSRPRDEGFIAQLPLAAVDFREQMPYLLAIAFFQHAVRRSHGDGAQGLVQLPTCRSRSLDRSRAEESEELRHFFRHVRRNLERHSLFRSQPQLRPQIAYSFDRAFERFKAPRVAFEGRDFERVGPSRRYYRRSVVRQSQPNLFADKRRDGMQQPHCVIPNEGEHGCPA